MITSQPATSHFVRYAVDTSVAGAGAAPHPDKTPNLVMIPPGMMHVAFISAAYTADPRGRAILARTARSGEKGVIIHGRAHPRHRRRPAQQQVALVPPRRRRLRGLHPRRSARGRPLPPP